MIRMSLILSVLASRHRPFHSLQSYQRYIPLGMGQRSPSVSVGEVSQPFAVYVLGRCMLTF